MSRPSKTGVRGLFRDKNTGRYRIDLRWFDSRTGQDRRYGERLPAGISAGAAKQRARELLDLALSGDLTDESSPATLSEGIAEYIRWCGLNRPIALGRREKKMRRFLAHLGDVPLDALTPRSLEDFKVQRAQEGARRDNPDLREVKQELEASVKPSTINRDLEVFAHFIGLMASWGRMDPGVAASLRAVPHLKEDPGRVRYLSPGEEERLMKAAFRPVQLIVQAAIHSGMRQGEILGLKRGAIDLPNRMITLTRTKSNEVRRVYINDDLAAVLEEAMERSTIDHVFVNGCGKPYTQDGLRTVFARTVHRAGIADFRFHDLRHTTATRLRQAGVGIDVIADVLGHASLAMAQRYVHVGDPTLQAAMATLAATDASRTNQRSALPLAEVGRRKPPRRREQRCARRRR